MVKYINLMLQAVKHIGSIKEFSMTEACDYMPERIHIVGMTADGERFTFDLAVGDCKNVR